MTVEEPWEVSEEDFPKSGQAEDKLHFLVNYACSLRLATTRSRGFST